MNRSNANVQSSVRLIKYCPTIIGLATFSRIFIKLWTDEKKRQRFLGCVGNLRTEVVCVPENSVVKSHTFLDLFKRLSIRCSGGVRGRNFISAETFMYSICIDNTQRRTYNWRNYLSSVSATISARSRKHPIICIDIPVKNPSILTTANARKYSDTQIAT